MRNTVYNAFIVPVFYLCVVLVISSFHDTFHEWDGVMQYFGSAEIISGKGYLGYQSHFWPPLFPSLIGLFSQMTTAFMAGKLVSIFSSVLTLWFVYVLMMEFVQNKKYIIFAQAFIAFNPIFLKLSFEVENHMVDTAFFIGSLYFLVRVVKHPGLLSNVVFLALFAGLATLSRYTSYSLLPLIAIALLFFSERKYIVRNVLVFLTLFVLVNMPWYYFNTIQNGSPLSTWQYMNIGVSITPGSKWGWWWSDAAAYSSLLEVFTAFPEEYIRNFISNVFTSLAITGKLVIFPLLVLLVYIFLNYRPILKHKQYNVLMKNRFFILLMLSFSVYILLVSQAFVFSEVFLSWIVLFTSAIFIIIQKIGEEKNFNDKLYKIMFVVIIFNILITSKYIYTYLNNKEIGGQLADNIQITKILRSQKDINQSYVMAVNPARAYHARSYFLMPPMYYEGNITDLVRYKNIKYKIRQYAPKYPSDSNLEILKADYFIYDIGLKRDLPQFSYLLEENSKVPDGFKVLYKSQKAVLFKIEHNSSHENIQEES